MHHRVCILGGGVTGLAAGLASGAPVYEAAAVPGGICSSYYVRPGTRARLQTAPADGEAYRFEIGGGHWIFGGDAAVLRWLHTLVPMKAYARRAAVYFPDIATTVPYPLQYHLAALGEEAAAQALAEMAASSSEEMPRTMAAWLAARFGATLTERFFGPFHARYTAGLWTEIAPQDPYKSPVDLALARQGAHGATPPTGYNVRFLYPEDGLDALARALARRGEVHYGRRAVALDLDQKIVTFEDETRCSYDLLVSTLPLNRMMAMAGLDAGVPDPYTSVLVLNLGAVRGPQCPPHHWLYMPESEAGFFRIGSYSNVEPAFLPASARAQQSRVALYVERAYGGGTRPSPEEVEAYAATVVGELQAWGFIEAAEVVDPTWIDVAYTWHRPGSRWRTDALDALGARDVLMVGRYARWTFQGIADSIRDGLVAGTTVR